MVIVSLVFALTVAPLIYLSVLNPELAVRLVGIPTAANWPPDLSSNVLTVLQQYFVFWNPSFTTTATPVFGLASALLITIGLIRLLRTRDTTRSYLVIIWIICLAPVLILNPIFTSVTFVPSMLMLAAGLTSLISYWYRLFPLNPYARVVGLIPIVILVSTLIVTGLARYSYGYHYSPSLATLFSNDLRLLPDNTQQLVVSEDEQAFYAAVAQANGARYEVVTQPTAAQVTVTRKAQTSLDESGYSIQKIITSARTTDANRFYIYQRADQ
jgi:hypothetical protein